MTQGKRWVILRSFMVENMLKPKSRRHARKCVCKRAACHQKALHVWWLVPGLFPELSLTFIMCPLLTLFIWDAHLRSLSTCSPPGTSGFKYTLVGARDQRAWLHFLIPSRSFCAAVSLWSASSHLFSLLCVRL